MSVPNAESLNIESLDALGMGRIENDSQYRMGVSSRASALLISSNSPSLRIDR